MSTQQLSARGAVWLDALTYSAPLQHGFPSSVRVVDARLGEHPARYIAVVPTPDNPFPRVRGGEVGLIEGWELARAVREVIDADAAREEKRPIVAIIDVQSQAYGRREEAYGIHQALAGAADAYASARLAGHPVIGLIVGRAVSGAFLAHGYQANRLIALADPQVMVHAMGKESAARITLRTVADLEAFAAKVPPMAYDIDNYASLGLLWKLLHVSNADAPSGADQTTIEKTLYDALNDIRADPSRGLAGRLASPHRAASATVRQKLREQWR
ncbi:MULTISPECIES: biotin-independent malonate decarboxylase subunit gamma [Paraburkholderia]|jgi:malonate decarboxylase gamma subunit|uniref:Malonate decarboxylase subunit gamma n=1 Tax=Paraburkholderia hospita TaxID=169430 RepID=A0AAJ5BAA3_9BURK|nr:biotin-independent malonate decarboxylase subunit gamma [Paraburkholderia hospita]EUC15687.1 malonate decarboxylase, gamma subunit [Burkholderia sp. BT03]AUT70867.1 biotin-independent malonate decarboxylase subunit gamma [Paraburkholderia hospita]AXF01928.1 biotin-independent malonate decarboxylase subunit gamma [Paraburkholderia hospita]EIM93607.1 malonate decarboxylase subunit gamma [Paraburkholderia hospita]OUL71682.1 biotin-independent malonate decarboxylase subunit gamma [Paraburkholde